MTDDSEDTVEGNGSGGEEEPPPLQELVERIRRDQVGGIEGGPSLDATPGGTPEGLFEQRSFDELDSDRLWESIGSERTFDVEGRSPVSAGGDHIVPKRWYCERCEFFSEPPDAHCTHDGTSIVEFIGMEYVQVRECPVVAERLALGEYSGDDESPVAPD